MKLPYVLVMIAGCIIVAALMWPRAPDITDFRAYCVYSGNKLCPWSKQFHGPYCVPKHQECDL